MQNLNSVSISSIRVAVILLIFWTTETVFGQSAVEHARDGQGVAEQNPSVRNLTGQNVAEGNVGGERQQNSLSVLMKAQQLADVRLNTAKDLNGHFPFVVPDSSEAWASRKEKLKRQVLVANGLWPMPPKSALNAVIHGPVERDGFTVQKVYFESLPNHFVTGLLFRPSITQAAADAKFPGILSPHGHGGRQFEYSDSDMKKFMASGAESLPESGRFPKMARCAHLARMGCVVFIFDMLGYQDSQQISRDVAHRYKTVRPEMEGLHNYGFFSGQAEGRLHSIMGLQTWNAVRALDFLSSLPDVDSKRLAVTGGSGGGTQTILLAALDDRPVAVFPNGMVSTSMQGGCTCENCSLLRIGTGNVELSALFAPKPQGMTAAKDWTVDMMTDGYPQLKQLYSMLGKPENVICEPLLQFPHNYNAVTRRIMYQFMQQHLNLDKDAVLDEVDWQPLTSQEYTVWNDDHPAPAGGIAYERALMQQLDDRDTAEMFHHAPSQQQLSQYLDIVKAGWHTIVGRTINDVGSITRTTAWKKKEDGYLLIGDLLTEVDRNEQVPVISVYPTSVAWNKEVVLWFSGKGKGGLFPNGTLHTDAKRLIDEGFSVVTADLFGQGELTTDGSTLTENPLVKNPRPFAGYTLGYNHTVFARRIHDVLKVICWVDSAKQGPTAIHLVGVEAAGPIVSVSRIMAVHTVRSAAIDTQGFRFAELTSWKHVDFLPGAIKYGDLPTALAFSASGSLWIAGEPSVPAVVQTARSNKGLSPVVLNHPASSNSTAKAAVDWLLRAQ